MRAWLLTVGVVALAACSTSSPRRSDISDAELLSGDILGPGFAAGAVTVTPIEDAFALDDQMRAFASTINNVSDPSFHVNGLLEAMQKQGLFALDYSSSTTRTVSETFHERRGNCLSFTMLFIELARAVGLHARYQLVEVPPHWNHEGDLVVIANHVNAVIESRFQHDLIIDFNYADFRGDYPMHKIDDAYASALYYTNLGAEALLKRDFPTSFVLLREALSFHDNISEPWVNLGVLYGRLGHYDYAEAAYLRALAADPRERSAVANLVGVYTALGDTARAEQYRDRVRNYQEINPYYHYSRAQTARSEERNEDALGELRRAIRLKNDDSDFFKLQGETLLALGRDEDAAKSFERARAVARPSSLVREAGSENSNPGRLARPAGGPGTTIYVPSLPSPSLNLLATP
jgi:tetratricopeptide (TPR) repeat protein